MAVVVSPFGLFIVISFSWEVMTWSGDERRQEETRGAEKTRQGERGSVGKESKCGTEWKVSKGKRKEGLKEKRKE